MKVDLIDLTSSMLLKRGYIVRHLKGVCFDVIARKGANVLLIKILHDANAIEERIADEIKTMSSLIHASAVIISEKAGEALLDGVVYSRFGVATLTLETLKKSLDNKLPLVKRNKAGLTAVINGARLKETREEKGYSLLSLSRTIGVSRSMIVKYESEHSEISLNKARELYAQLGDKIFDTIDVLSSSQFPIPEGQSELSHKYIELGFEAVETKHFDIIAKKDKELILTEVGDKELIRFKILTQMLEADVLVIFSRKKPHDVPALTKKEFMKFESGRDLVKFLKEF